MASKIGPAVVHLLLDKGADPEAPTQEGETPLHFASRAGRDANARLLLDKGADINALTSDGETPLHVASEAWNDNAAVVRLLLDRGADTSVRTTWGVTPLGVAARRGRAAIVQMLTEAGAGM
jgi:ankyrin repeat protein